MVSPVHLIAVTIGYLFGSISFARLITRLVAPDKNLDDVSIPYDSGGEHHMAAVGATTASLVLGAKWGMIISLLDILKGFLPALIFRLLFAGENYYLFAGGAAIVGHIYPIFFRFRGGYGISPILGSLLVLDPLGVLLTNLIGMALGFFVFREIILVMFGGTWLMILWAWLVRHDPVAIWYVVFCNFMLVFAAIPELVRHLRDRRSGKVDMDELMNKFPMGQMSQKMFRRITPKKTDSGSTDVSQHSGK